MIDRFLHIYGSKLFEIFYTAIIFLRFYDSIVFNALQLYVYLYANHRLRTYEGTIKF